MLPISMRLASVCRSWRAVALSTPRLWANLHFFADYDSPYTINYLSKYTLYLNRSRPAPLTYTLGTATSTDDEATDEDTDDEATDDSLYPKFVEVLLQHADHWFDITIQSPKPDLQLSIPVNLSCPLLRRLSLDGPEHNTMSISTHDAQMPSLRCVTLSFLSLGNCRLPWSQLHALSIAEFGPDMAQFITTLDALNKCSELRYLFIELVEDHGSFPVITETLKLPKVTLLALTVGEWRIAKEFMDKLYCPLITEFLIHGFGISTDFDAVLQFLTRHSATIRNLGIGSSIYSDEYDEFERDEANGFSRLWDSVPGLVGLKLCYHEIGGFRFVDSLLQHYRKRKSAKHSRVIEELSIDVRIRNLDDFPSFLSKLVNRLDTLLLMRTSESNDRPNSIPGSSPPLHGTSFLKFHIQIGYSVGDTTNGFEVPFARIPHKESVISSMLDDALRPLEERGLRYSCAILAQAAKRTMISRLKREAME